MFSLVIEDQSFMVKVHPLTDAPDVSYHCSKLQINRGFTRTFNIVDVLEQNENIQKENLLHIVEKIKDQVGLVPPYKIILMEMCDGNLKEFINDVLPTMGRQEQITCIRQFFGDMINAMYTLHRHKLVHGDIKPENIGYKRDTTKDEYNFKLFDFDGLTKEGSPIRFISPTYSVYNYVRRKAELLHDCSAIVDTCLQFCRILTPKDHYMFHFTEKQQLENLLGQRIEYPAAGKVIDLILGANDVPRDIKNALMRAVRYIQTQNEEEDFDETFINRIRAQFRITSKR